MSIKKQVEVVCQKNVIVYVTEKDSITFTPIKRYVRTFNYKQFFQWLEVEKIKSFIFRPSDPKWSDLILRRVKKIELVGFTVVESDNDHFYKHASR